MSLKKQSTSDGATIRTLHQSWLLRHLSVHNMGMAPPAVIAGSKESSVATFALPNGSPVHAARNLRATVALQKPQFLLALYEKLLR
jgi:hypothetical protein